LRGPLAILNFSSSQRTSESHKLYFELRIRPAQIIVVFDFIHGWEVQVIALDELAHLFQVFEIAVNALLIIFSDIDDSSDYLDLVVRSRIGQRRLTQLTIIRPHLQILFVADELFSCFGT
jgi:hypothetical protein